MKCGALILSVFLCASARAELKWEQTTLEVHPAFGAKQAVGYFKYENAGKTPVIINLVHASCGCTAAHALRNPIDPGEKGEITVTFNIGDRKGTQIRDVTVQSSDPDHGRATTTLLLKAVIAPPLEVQPALVYWNGGEDPRPKTIMVKAAKGTVNSIKVTVSDPAFQAGFEPVGDSEFKIKVQPKQTAKPDRATITIQAEGSPKIFSATAIVTGKPAPPNAASR
ncbi:MAG TPA: DUF1573 domain-containing protein [Chthoniobacterales bacterium]|nr:DUF1573 domain-containing protein [Chthoniobacterales bacterium]